MLYSVTYIFKEMGWPHRIIMNINQEVCRIDLNIFQEEAMCTHHNQFANSLVREKQ